MSDSLSILHADMDAFYAAVEVLDDPSLKGVPLIIGHPGRRGVVATASYEARRFGVHSAMPSAVAMRLCPNAVWRPGRGRRYVEVSRQIRAIFESYTPLVEPLSLDEAFLDIGGSCRLFGSAIDIARQLKDRVRSEIGLTVSVGVAENKFLAKVASDLEKPDGLTVVPAGRGEEFLRDLPVRRLWGVGPKSAAHLERLSLRTIGDLVRAGHDFLVRQLGPGMGEHIWALAHGRDGRRVVTDHLARSISTESTFGEDLTDPATIRDFLFQASGSVAATLRREGFRAKTVQLKVRTGDYTTFTRAHTLEVPTDLPEPLYRTAVHLLETRVDLAGRGVRLLGVGAKGLLPASAPVQGDLFSESTEGSARVVSELTDRIRESLGPRAIGRARELRRRRGLDDRLGDDDPSRLERPGLGDDRGSANR
ncbi:MAG: DNA polymerase IV [Planctomycetes bacterium]|nr:DNA polymerase IV [Planctomycetota bacterium]